MPLTEQTFRAVSRKQPQNVLLDRVAERTIFRGAGRRGVVARMRPIFKCDPGGFAGFAELGEARIGIEAAGEPPPELRGLPREES